MTYFLFQLGVLADMADDEEEAMYAADQLSGDVEIFVHVATKGMRE